MKRILNSLHIGVANRGRWPLDRCNAETGFQPIALCDPDPDALAAARELTGLDASDCYSDPAEAMKHPGLACVIICAPTRFHVPLAKQALEHGLPVLVEKGMAPDYASAEELVAAADTADLPVCVAQNYRYNPLEQTVAACLHDPEHPAHPGEVHSVNYIQHRVRPHPRTLDYPFASIWDMSCHHFDNLAFWFGGVETMTASSFAAKWSAYSYDNNTTAMMRFANGTAVTYEHTHDAARNQVILAMHGERGALWLDDGKLYFSERPTEQLGSRPAQDVTMASGTGERGVLADFHRYVCEGVEPGISVRKNLEVMAMCQMMVESITHQRTVSRDQIASLTGAK